jgi:Domain of unknown function (DUF4406)
MRVYLAGPMCGYPQFSQEAFIEGAQRLREKGHEVWSPYEDSLASGLDTAGMSGNQAEAERVRPLRECLAADLSWISLHVEAVVVMEGWEASLGATAEAAAARALGIPVIRLEDLLDE